MAFSLTIRAPLAVACGCWLFAPCARAAVLAPSPGLSWTAPGGPSGSVPWNIVVLLTVLVWVVIIAAKLSRLERETGELVELARRAAADRGDGDG